MVKICYNSYIITEEDEIDGTPVEMVTLKENGDTGKEYKTRDGAERVIAEINKAYLEFLGTMSLYGITADTFPRLDVHAAGTDEDEDEDE